MLINPPYKNHKLPKYSKHINNAVNIQNVITISIGRENYYPDNTGIPTIDFTFIGGQLHRWYLNNENDAQEIYNTLINKNEQYNKP